MKTSTLAVITVAAALAVVQVDAVGVPRAAFPTGASKSKSRFAMAIPGNSPVEMVLVDGTSNFLAIYNYLISARILLSWFPQAAGISALRPIYQLCDPYLNLFRGLIPPIGPVDISVLPAFFLLNFAQSAVPALGAQVPHSAKADKTSERKRRSHVK